MNDYSMSDVKEFHQANAKYTYEYEYEDEYDDTYDSNLGSVRDNYDVEIGFK